MRSDLVEVSPPCVDDVSGVAQAVEQVLVQAFVSEPTDEAFAEAILHRLAGRDVVPADAAILASFQDGV